MGFPEILTTVATIITELNKAEDNTQQKKFLVTLRRIEREIKKQQNSARQQFIIGIVASGIVSFVIGYLLK